MWNLPILCHKCNKIYAGSDCRKFRYTVDCRYEYCKKAFICKGCYALVALCCKRLSLIDRCTIVRNYSDETRDIRDTMTVIRKLGVGCGGLKPGLSLFTKQILVNMFILPIATIIYEYMGEKEIQEIHLDLLSEYYQANQWYCNRCGNSYTLFEDTADH
jgi:hypothetical protein